MPLGDKTSVARLPEVLVLNDHAWRGVIDGDGYVSAPLSRGRRTAIHLGLRSASQFLLDQFATFVGVRTGAAAGRYDGRAVVTGGVAVAIVGALYVDAPNTIARKRKKALRLAAEGLRWERDTYGNAVTPPAARELVKRVIDVSDEQSKRNPVRRSTMSVALTLRPYQEEAIAAVESAVERGVQRPLLVLPTGCGKTLVFASLIAKRGGSALVLAHRDELLRQAAEKIAIADPTLALGVGFVAAQRDDVHAPVVGSVQTLARASRLAKLPRRFDTVVVDEAHHASARSYRRILEHLSPTPLILGVTATPARADGKQLGDVWQEIVYQRGIAEMIRAGYLADIRGVERPRPADIVKTVGRAVIVPACLRSSCNFRVASRWTPRA